MRFCLPQFGSDHCLNAGSMVEDMLGRTRDISEYFSHQRCCDPARMGSTLLFLVSPSSERVAGTVIKVDDGQLGR